MMAARLLRQEQCAEWDLLLVALAIAHGTLLISFPSVPLIAVGLWWNANTISHCFIHRPFFRSRAMNSGFSICLSLLLGFPQSWWRKRHLEHHAANGLTREGNRLTLAPLDSVAVLALWAALLAFDLRFALTVYLPGFLLGVALCYLQGHYEHAHGTISHYGWLYNFLFFNDGYHVEHHAKPGAHWRELPRHKSASVSSSCWPAVLRWIECVNLCGLERLVLRSSLLQRFVVARHESAFRLLLARISTPRRVAIVGGGLFPRTAIILQRLIPESKLTLIDLSAENLDIARRFIRGDVEFINERFEPTGPCDFDLLVIPLAFKSDRDAFYRQPVAPVVVVHDWIWRKRGTSAIVSWLLLKRMNLVLR